MAHLNFLKLLLLPMITIISATEFLDADSVVNISASANYVMTEDEQIFFTKLTSKQSAITQKEIDQSIIKSAKKGWLKTVTFLTTKSADGQPLPTKERINWALNNAAKGDYLAIVEHLIKLPEPMKPDQNGVNWALNSAVKLRHLSVIETLLTPTTEQINPNLNGINKALRGAIRQTDDTASDCILNSILVTHQHDYQPSVQDNSNESQELQSIVDFLLAPREIRARLVSINASPQPEDIFSAEYNMIFMPIDAAENWDSRTIMCEEALIINSASIIKACLAMFENPQTITLITDLLPPTDETNKSFDIVFSEFSRQLDAIYSLTNPNGKFKISQAQRALSLLNGDETIERHSISKIHDYQNYQMHGLPNIRQAFVLAYKLMTRQFNVENFIKSWLAQQYIKQSTWQELHSKSAKIRASFPALEAIIGQSDIGSALRKDESKGSPFVKEIVMLVNGTSDTLLLPLKDFKSLCKSMYGYLNDQLNPLIEALFMIMRGHNSKLNDPDEKNRPACAKGAYIGILKAISEIPDFHAITKTCFAGVEVLDCA